MRGNATQPHPKAGFFALKGICPYTPCHWIRIAMCAVEERESTLRCVHWRSSALCTLSPSSHTSQYEYNSTVCAPKGRFNLLNSNRNTKDAQSVTGILIDNIYPYMD
jgi:hypothetical protein